MRMPSATTGGLILWTPAPGTPVFSQSKAQALPGAPFKPRGKKDKLKAMTILPGLTSTQKDRIPAFIAGLTQGALRQISFFPTCLLPRERQAVYTDLEKIGGLTIPHVHIRGDFDQGELEYLMDRFHTEVFNAHPAQSRFPQTHFPSHLKSHLFIENVEIVPSEGELGDCGGLCIDYSHWENSQWVNWEGYERMDDLVRRFPIGCCHLSAVRRHEVNRGGSGYDHHFFRQLGDFDYLVQYKDHLPPRWLSLELENTWEEQVEAKAYLEKILF